MIEAIIVDPTTYSRLRAGWRWTLRVVILGLIVTQSLDIHLPWRWLFLLVTLVFLGSGCLKYLIVPRPSEPPIRSRPAWPPGD